jgi:hypothetical protein
MGSEGKGAWARGGAGIEGNVLDGDELGTSPAVVNGMANFPTVVVSYFLSCVKFQDRWERQ